MARFHRVRLCIGRQAFNRASSGSEPVHGPYDRICRDRISRIQGLRDQVQSV